MKKFIVIMLSILFGMSFSMVVSAANTSSSGKTSTEYNFNINKSGKYQLVATIPPVGEGAFLCGTSISYVNSNDPASPVKSTTSFSPSTMPISFCHPYNKGITIPSNPINSSYFGASCNNEGGPETTSSTLTITFNAENFSNIDTIGINCVAMGNVTLAWKGPSST